MTAIRSAIALLCLFAASLGCAAAELPPTQIPQLRIDSEMHTALIGRLDVSADGRLLVTGSHDKTVRLWSLPDGKFLRAFHVPVGPNDDGKIYAVALSPDGRMIAAAGLDAYAGRNSDVTFIYLFDTVTGAMVKRLGPLPQVVNDLAFSNGGRRLVAGLGANKGIRMWEYPFTAVPKADTSYGSEVYGVAFDRSGLLATTSLDGTIRLYGRDFSLPPKTLKAPGGRQPFDIDFSPDGKTLAVGYADTLNIDLLSVADLARVHRVDTGIARNGDLSKVAWSADGKYLYAGGRYDDGTGIDPVVRWPDAGRGKPEHLGGALGTIFDLAALPGGGVVFASADPAFGAFGADGKALFFRRPVNADMRNKLKTNFAASRDGLAVWFGLKQGAADPYIFDAAHLSFTAAPERPKDFITPETETLPIKGWKNRPKPLLDGTEIPLAPNERCRSLAIAPDARSFVVGTEWSIYRFDDKAAKVWRKKTEGAGWGVNLSADGQIIIAAHGDGTIRWYRASDGADLLTLFVNVPDKRWIAWTPSGYYAASPGGEDLIGWQVNGKTWDAPSDFFPASLFRNRFYRPDIVQTVLKIRDEFRAVEQANLIAKRRAEDASLAAILPPVIELLADPRGMETANPELMLKYRLRSPSGRKVTRLELRIDGQNVQARGMEAMDEAYPLDTELTIRVPLPQHDAEVSLIAFIDDQASDAASIPVKWTGRSRDGPKPKLFALLVGVSAYDDQRLKLNYAAKDATDMAAAFKRQEGRYFSSVETVVLTDHRASENKIEIELTRLRDKAGPDDYAVVFMAGHGVTDPQGGFHFLPADASLAPDEMPATSLNGIIIRDNLRTMKGKVLLFMDACNAGNGITGGESLADMTGFANDVSRESNGVVMFASSTGRQFSYENAEWGNGAFTRAILSILNDREAFGRDGQLSIFELAEELTVRVEAMTNTLQTPVMTKPGAMRMFSLAATD